MATSLTTNDSPGTDTAGIPAWQEFGNALVQYHAVLRRLTGLPPNDMAGVFIGDAEIDRVVSELPGLDGPSTDQLEPIRQQLAPALESCRMEFHKALGYSEEPFYRIARNSGASSSELEVFAVIAAVELSPQLQRLVGYLQDNVSAHRIWLSTLNNLFPSPHPGIKAVSESAPLKRSHLLQVANDEPWSVCPVTLPQRVAWALENDDSLDPDLPISARVHTSPVENPGNERMAVITGSDREARLQTAFRQCQSRTFLVTSMPEDSAQWQAITREATITGMGIVLEVENHMPPAARFWIERAGHLVWAISAEHDPALDLLPELPWREFRVSTGEATNDDWERVLGVSPTGVHRLSHEQLRLVNLAYPAVGHDIDAAVRRLVTGKLDGLAIRVRPSRDWDSLILPPHQLRQARELVSRYRHKGTVYGEWGFKPVPSSGIVGLFSGQSGTGKTLTAEVIAADLNLDLYKVDLSSIVSKYIGETEKNLEAIFTAAGSESLVLFFDEADALFGKRSEVSDAHDRYANIEVAYLLQRLETYNGLVLLASNLQGNIDQAFLRRIHVAIDFTLPEKKQREAIWRISFAPQSPIDDLDFDFLASAFKLTGGTIHNAALTAAFMAAEACTKISMSNVALGVKREYEKMGRLIEKEEFGPYYEAISEQDDVRPGR